VKLDATEQKTPGWKFNFWEMKGVPIRIEIGPRDVAESVVVIARRDIPGKEGKEFGVPIEEGPLQEYVMKKLEEIQQCLLERATTFRESNILDVKSYEELKGAIAEGKWARGPWAGTDADEAQVKDETGATIRCFPFEQPPHSHVCLKTSKQASEVAIFAKSY
jgi:prolyl-tRNA synthetase